MAPITWRNINAPDFRDSILALGSAGQSMDSAAEGINKLFTESARIGNLNWDNQARLNTEDAIAQMRSIASLPEFYQQQGNYDMAGLRPRFGSQINADTLQAALAKRLTELNEAAQLKSAAHGQAVAAQTGSPAQGAQATVAALNEAGIRDPRAMQAGLGLSEQLLKPQQAAITEQQDANYSQLLLNDITPDPNKKGNQYEKYAPIAKRIAEEEGVPYNLVERVITTESSWDPNAISPKGATGLMQLMPGTAAGLKVNPNDPEQNLRGGIRYLKENLNRFNGDVEKTVSAYNAGPAGNFNNPETTKYRQKVLAGLRPEQLLEHRKMLSQEAAQQENITTSKLNREKTQYELDNKKSIEEGVNTIIRERQEKLDPTYIPESLKNNPNYATIVANANKLTNEAATLSPWELQDIKQADAAIDSDVARVKGLSDAEIAAEQRKVDSFAGSVMSDEQLEEIDKKPSGLAGVLSTGVDQPGIFKDFIHSNAFHDDVQIGISQLQRDLISAGNTPKKSLQIITSAMKLAGADRLDSAGKKSIRMDKIMEQLTPAVERVNAYNAAKANLNAAQAKQNSDMQAMLQNATNVKADNTKTAATNKFLGKPYQDHAKVAELKLELATRIEELKEKQNKTKPDKPLTEKEVYTDPVIKKLVEEYQKIAPPSHDELLGNTVFNWN